MRQGKISRIYVSSVLMFANTFLAFLFINAVAFAGLSLYEYISKENPVSEKYGEEKIKSVYPGMGINNIQDLLHETWSRPYVYEPFTQFREGAYEGKYVNVDIHGFRDSQNQAAWPPPNNDVNIFLFGGSTVFGYGVEDKQTIASHLQSQLRKRLGLRVNIYNFGRGFYYSTQERILFESLLASGYVPDIAVFVDGLNDFYHIEDKPLFTNRLGRYVNGEAKKITILSKLPIMRLFNELIVKDSLKPGMQTENSENIDYEDPELLNNVISRYFRNKKLIESVSAAHAVKALFVWQPVPTFNYDNSHHLFAGADYGRHNFSRFGYPMIKTYVENSPQGDEFLWAADLQENVNYPLYVDQVHYTGEFSGRLAEYISEYLALKFFQE